MTPTKSLAAFASRSLLAFLFSIVAFGAAPAQAVIEPAGSDVQAFYLAKDDGEGYVGEAAESFATTDVPIHCVIELKTADTATVTMNFVAVSVPRVKAGSRIVSTSYTTKDGENMVSFRGRPPGNRTAGLYRVDIFVRDKLAASHEFSIVNRLVPAAQMRFVDAKPTPTRSPAKPKPRPRKN